MAFFLSKISLNRLQNRENASQRQSVRESHMEPGNREKTLLREDPILKRFKSQKRNVNVLRRMGDVLAVVVIAGCCYQVYVRSVMREEARKQAESANETE